MILADISIQSMQEIGLVIDPEPDDIARQPASVDLKLGKVYRRINPALRGPVRIGDPNIWGKEETSEGQGFVIRPDEFLLASTEERITVPNGFAAQIGGKSTGGRSGLLVHATAGFIDPGFSKPQATVTLELKNLLPVTILLVPGEYIAQIVFFACTSKSKRPYGSAGLGSHYQGQSGATLPGGSGD